MSSLRIVVVDEAIARLYEFQTEPVGFRLAEEIANESPGQHERDLVSVGAGRRSRPASARRQTLVLAAAAHLRARRMFARRVGDWLDDVVLDTDGARFVLIAPPRMLGLLRAALSRRVRALVVVAVPKDLARADHASLEHSLRLALRRARRVGGNSGSRGT